MRNTLMQRLASLMCLMVAAFAAPAIAQPQANVAPLQYSERTLANGLRVYSMPDPDTANVSVHVWYRVGSKDDPAGRSGFAHLFEHIMFKATRNMAPEQFDRLTEDVGGFNNASTADDYTNYYSVVPANHLERILWAEAERMGSLAVQPEFFNSERDVVKEEYRQRILASPYGKLFGLYLVQTAFQVHPYGRPGIGSIQDLDAATIEDVRQFHYAYYRPDNAILVVSGRYAQRDLDRFVDTYFAPLKNPAFPTPRVKAVEPARTGPKTYTVYEPNVPLPAVVVNYPMPAATHPDFPALMVMDAILSKGESSRLYQSLVYSQQIAAEVFTDLSPSVDPGAMSIAAILSEGKTGDDGIRALLGEVAKMRTRTVTRAELDEAKNQILTERLGERETAFGRAFELAYATLITGDPKSADAMLGAIQRVNANDVRRVARTWLNDSRRIEIKYLPVELKPENASSDAIASAATISAPPLTIAGSAPILALAPASERISPPQPAAPVAARIPEIAERSLPNGLKVFIATRRGVPLVSADLRVLSGLSAEPAGKAGLAALTADLLTKGTKTRTATEIARAVEALGATLGAGAGADAATLSLTTRAARAREGFALMADVARNPVFAADELERARQQMLDGLTVQLRQPGALARFAMTRALYGASPYGATATPKSLGAIASPDAIAYHQAHWRPDNAILVITGDVSVDEAMTLAQGAFGDWRAPEGAPAPEPDVAAAGGARRVIVVDLPKSGQAAVMMGARAITRDDPTYFPALVASTVLGGGYSARLNQEIRIKRGLSYGAGASLVARKGPGAVTASAQTKNESALEVAALMRAELQRLGAEPVIGAELTARKATLIGAFGRDVETNAGMAGQISAFAGAGLTMDDLRRYVGDVDGVTPDQLRTAAQRLYDPERATLVIAGDGAVFFDGLKARYPQAERIGVDVLNLDKPELR